MMRINRVLKNVMSAGKTRQNPAGSKTAQRMKARIDKRLMAITLELYVITYYQRLKR